MLAANPYATGVLKPSVQAPLVEKLEIYADDAGIRPEHVWTSMLGTEITEAEIKYLRTFRRNTINGILGLVLVGEDPQRDLIETMSLMAGHLVRNFINARMMLLADLMDHIEADGYPECTCLLIPDFALGVGDPSDMPKIWVSRLHALLHHRYVNGRQTVVHVSSMDAVKLGYRGKIGRHLKTHFTRVDVA